MVFKRNYEKRFEGTDLDYLIREKLKEDFPIPRLLKVMKMCLQSKVEKRIDLITLNDEFKSIENNQYFLNHQLQKTYLSEEPMDLFSYNTVDSI